MLFYYKHPDLEGIASHLLGEKTAIYTGLLYLCEILLKSSLLQALLEYLPQTLESLAKR